MNNLKFVRKVIGLSAAKLAQLAGTYPANIFLLESGRHVPHKKTRDKIELALHCKIDWMENEPVQYEDSNYYLVERLIKRLYGAYIMLDVKDQAAINKLIHKYFKN